MYQLRDGPNNQLISRTEVELGWALSTSSRNINQAHQNIQWTMDNGNPVTMASSRVFPSSSPWIGLRKILCLAHQRISWMQVSLRQIWERWCAGWVSGLMFSHVGFFQWEFFNGMKFDEHHNPCPYKLNTYISCAKWRGWTITSVSPTANHQPLLTSFGKCGNMKELLRHSWVVCLIESMSPWTNHSTWSGWSFVPGSHILRVMNIIRFAAVQWGYCLAWSWEREEITFWTSICWILRGRIYSWITALLNKDTPHILLCCPGFWLCVLLALLALN